MKLLILSDIHGNWAALEAVLRAELLMPAQPMILVPRKSGPRGPDLLPKSSRRGAFTGQESIERETIVFCGDVVDYGPQPVECLRWVAQHADYAVRGNHDNALAFAADCRCMGSFREYSLATRAWHRTLVSDGDREFLGKLPTLQWFQWGGRHFRMAHATPQGDLYEYLNKEQWGQRVEGLAADFVLLGHTHVQGMRSFGEVTVVNPGSVGLARDHQGIACYAVYEGGTMQLKQCRYDVQRTVAGLEAAPLPKAVIEGLGRVLGVEM